MSTASPDEQQTIATSDRRIRLLGLAIAVFGIFLLFLDPYVASQRRYDGVILGQEPTTPLYYALVAAKAVSVVSVVPAAITVWGASALWTGRIRSLTPERSVAAVFLSVLPAIWHVHVPPPCIDFCDPWSAPSSVPELLRRIFDRGALALTGASFFFVAGVARARDDSGWTRRSTAYALLCALGFWLVDLWAVIAVLFWLTVSVVPGLPVLAFGYWGADVPGDRDGNGGETIPKSETRAG